MKNRRKKGGFDDGMTEEERIEMQRKLFEKAKNYDYSDSENAND